MKLEIEITEQEIKSAIERKIRVAVAEYSNSYESERLVRDIIKTSWRDSVDRIILDEIANSDKMRDTIRAELEKKIKAQLQAVINKAKV